MEAVREITKWKVDYRPPNHDYLLDGDKVVAYRKWGEGPVIECSGRIKLDRRYRKFIKLEDSPFKIKANIQPMVVEVIGSKGQTYFVNTEEKTCTCPGHKFRGTCKHLEAQNV